MSLIQKGKKKPDFLLQVPSIFVNFSKSAANHLRNPHFSGDHDQIVWFSGYDDISVTKLSDLKSIHYNNFLPIMGPNKQPVALRSVMANNGEKIVVSFMVDNLFGVAYYHKSIKEPHAYTLSEVAPACNP